jgi:hypothetical protein
MKEIIVHPRGSVKSVAAAIGNTGHQLDTLRTDIGAEGCPKLLIIIHVPGGEGLVESLWRIIAARRALDVTIGLY